jgi:predicted MarR family transcription regulator
MAGRSKAAATNARAAERVGGSRRDSLLEAAVTQFEWSIWRLSAAFIAWQGELMSALTEQAFSGHDTALLHVVALKGKAKGLSEIARLLGRDDYANVQYAIKKLHSLGLIARMSGRSRKETAYQVSEEGLRLIRAYREKRGELLVGLIEQLPEASRALVDTARRLDLLTAFYDGATRRALASVAPTNQKKGDSQLGHLDRG